MADVDDISVISLPWRAKTASNYQEACAVAEVRVTVASQHQAQALAGVLAYDKRKSVDGGRALAADFPELGLRKHGRLEPSSSCPDVGQLEHSDTFPLEGGLLEVLTGESLQAQESLVQRGDHGQHNGHVR